MASPARTRADRRIEEQLLTRIHAEGDPLARRDMIERGMSLVHHVARRYENRGISLEELVQVGSVGLIKAVDRFDPARGVVFSTFAIPTIMGEIRRHFRDHGWALRVTRSVQENCAAVVKATDRLTTTLQRHPTHAEIAAATRLSVEQVLEALAGARHYAHDSLDAPLGGAGEDAGSRMDITGSVDRGYRQVDARLAVEQGMAHLQERERRILDLRFRHDRTQAEIADELGISQMHVSRLLRRALETMHEHLSHEPDAVRTAD